LTRSPSRTGRSTPARRNGPGASTTTAVSVAKRSPLSKGALPSTAANSVEPSENRSDCGPASPLLNCSGEMKAGLPVGRQRRRQRSPRQHLHDDPGTAALPDDVVDLDGADVVDPGRGSSLVERLYPNRPACRVGRLSAQIELLDRDEPVQHLVLGEPDPAHTAGAQQRPEPVTARHQPSSMLDREALDEFGRAGRGFLFHSGTQPRRAAGTPTWHIQEGLHSG
jgi:hypothetical protein